MLRALYLVALLEARVVRLDVVVNDELDLVGIKLEPRTHVLGNVVGVECAVVNIAEDGLCTVVSRNNDKAAIIT